MTPWTNAKWRTKDGSDVREWRWKNRKVGSEERREKGVRTEKEKGRLPTSWRVREERVKGRRESGSGGLWREGRRKKDEGVREGW